MKNWKVQIYNFILLCLLLGAANVVYGQDVKKSGIKETIDGKEYYLHFVKKGETLYNIARAYGITVDDIFKSNAAAREGIKPGNILKIPVEEKMEEPAQKQAREQKEDYFYHIVKRKETLFGLSRKYNVPVDAIRQLNPGSGTELREGETLKIPYASEIDQKTLPEKTIPTTQHTIASGETLYAIAKQYNVTTGEIINANPGIDPLDLDIGQKINIPNQESEKEDQEKNTGSEKNDQFIEHTVEKGETLYSIAREYAVNIDTLKKYNNGLSMSLYIGQKIRIPSNPVDKDYIIYKPDRREKLEDIADKYKIDYDEVSEINPDINRKAKRGQTVKIPVEKPEVMETDTAEKEDQQMEIISFESPCPENPESHFKTYNIALMLPLFLEEVDSLEQYRERGLESTADLVSFRFLNFYAGFKMAVDSMEKQGMKMNLFVYDVDNDPQKVNRVLQKSELSSMDLIVGPLYAKSFARVANFAKTYQIPIVNPLSNREEIVGNNPWVFKLKPDEEIQTDLLVRYLLDHYPESNIVLVRHNKYKYQPAVSYIRNYLNTKRPGHVMIPNSKIAEAIAASEEDQIFTENKVLEKEMINRGLTDSTWISNLVKEVIYVDDSIQGLENNLSAIRKNVVVALSEDIVFSKELMSQLNKLSLDHDITLFGLPDWNSFHDLETNQLLHLHVHTFTSSLIDYHDPHIKKWIEKYRNTFHTEPTPGNYAFDGFDTGWYFLNALYQYGSEFSNCIKYFSIPLIQTKFRFESNGSNGFRNTFWNMGKYEDYRYQRVRLPDTDSLN